MAGVHGLQHIQRLAATDLTHDDALRAHTQRRFDQVPNGDLSCTRGIGVASLQTDQILDALDLQLRRVLDGDDTLILGDVVRQRIQEGGLAGAGTSADEDVILGLHQHLQLVCDLLRQRPVLNELGNGHRGLGELSDGDRGAAQGNGRQHHIDTGAVGKPGVADRVGLIDLTARKAHDPLDDILQLPLALELLVQLEQPSILLDEYVFRPVDHHFRDGVILDDGVQQAKATDGAIHLLHDGDPLLDGAVPRSDTLLHDILDLLLQLAVADLAERQMLRHIPFYLGRKLLFLLIVHLLYRLTGSYQTAPWEPAAPEPAPWMRAHTVAHRRCSEAPCRSRPCRTCC